MTGGTDWILAIESAVLHGTWQVAAIGAAVAIVFASRPTLRPAIRADIASAALLASAATFVFTCCWSLAHTDRSAPLPALPDLSSMSAAIVDEASKRGTTGSDGGVTGYAVAFAWSWVAGLLVLTSWTLVQALRVRRLRSRTSAAPSDWQARFERLARHAGVGSGVRLLASRIVDVPMVVGWLRPVILMPAAAFTAMPRDQLEVVLLHELAHIRRHDPVLDLLQLVAVNLVFFHPVAWWLRRIAVVQRELACDDDATVDREASRSLAQALLRIQSLRHAGVHARLLTPLSSQGDPLMSRITRLLTDSSRLQRRDGSARGRLAAGTAALAIGFSMTLAWARPVEPPISTPTASVPVEMLETLSDALKRSVADGEISEKDAMAMYKMFAEGFAADLHKDERTADLAATAKRKLVEGQKLVEGMPWPAKVVEGVRYPGKTGSIFEHLDRASGKTMDLSRGDIPVIGELFQNRSLPSLEKFEAHFDAVDKKVASGELSPEEAEWIFKKLETAYEKAMITRLPRLAELEASFGAIAEKIERGVLSPEEAEAIFERLEAKFEARNERSEIEAVFIAVEKKLEAGILTEEEAGVILEKLESAMERAESIKIGRKIAIGVDLEQDAEELEEYIEAVEKKLEAGLLTEEEAEPIFERLEAKFEARSEIDEIDEFDMIEAAFIAVERKLEAEILTEEEAEAIFERLELAIAAIEQNDD